MVHSRNQINLAQQVYFKNKNLTNLKNMLLNDNSFHYVIKDKKHANALDKSVSLNIRVIVLQSYQMKDPEF